MVTRGIESRLERLEAYVAIENRMHIKDYSLEERELLREIARRIAERIRTDRIEPGDEETMRKIIAEENKKVRSLEQSALSEGDKGVT